MEEMGGRRLKRLVDNLKEEKRYWDAKKKALSSLAEELPLEEAMDRQKTEWQWILVINKSTCSWRTSAGISAAYLNL
jgi:hypothetical protein